MDEDIAGLMRRTDPARTREDDRSESQIAAELQRITQPEVAPVAAHGRRWPWIAVPGLVAAVAVLAFVIQLWNPFVPTPSAAATPPLLPLTATSQSLGGVMDNARVQLAATADYEAQRHASFEGWYLQTDVGQRSSRSTITPEEQQVEWNADLSGSMTIKAGRSYTPAAGENTVPETPPSEGTVLRHEVYGPGEMPLRFPAPPPTTGEEMRDYLATATGLDAATADAYAYLSAIRVLLSEWTLGPGAQAAVLDVLQASPGITVAGDVTDRLGRPGIALRAVSPDVPQFEYLVVISRDSGAVIALETVYLGGRAELDIKAPCVIEYTAWK